MIIARDGLKIILPAFLLAFVLLLSSFYFELPFLMLAFWVVFVFFLFSTWFFRDPVRDTPMGENLIISPADGTVVEICPVEDEFVGKAQRISIFMSILSVHVNRIPISGIIESIQYSKGRFLPAMKPETTFENEQNTICLKSDRIRVKFSQIAGLIARRIICRIEKSDSVETGQRFGLIMFGSRVDLIIPESVVLNIKLKEKVTAGKTVIGEIT